MALLFDALYFKTKFLLIPAAQWCAFYPDDETGRKCALGHCGAVHFQPLPEEAQALKNLIFHIEGINDGMPEFLGLGSDPRTRVLTSLDGIL